MDNQYQVPIPPRVDYFNFLLDKIPILSDDELNVLYYAVWSESMDRKFDSMFDNEEEGEQ